MVNIKELTKNTLFQLKNENIQTTPENYFVEFKKQSYALNAKIEEIELFEKIKESLTNEEKQNKIESFKDLAIILAKRTSKEELKKLIFCFEQMLTPSADFNFI